MHSESIVYDIARQCLVFYSLTPMTFFELQEKTWEATRFFVEQLSLIKRDSIFEAIDKAVQAGCYDATDENDLITAVLTDAMWELIVYEHVWMDQKDHPEEPVTMAFGYIN